MDRHAGDCSEKLIGTWVGIDVTPEEVCREAEARFRERVAVFDGISMSKPIKIFAANTFCLPVLSYLWRVLFFPESVLRRIDGVLRDFILPVPTVKLMVLSHLRRRFGIQNSLHDVQSMNVAAIIATAVRLESSDIGNMPLQHALGLGGHPMRMWEHVRRAFHFFRAAVGETVHWAIRSRDSRSERLAHAVYERLLQADADAVDAYFTQRLRNRGLDGALVFDHLARIPSTVPQQHRWALL